TGPQGAAGATAGASGVEPGFRALRFRWAGDDAFVLYSLTHDRRPLSPRRPARLVRRPCAQPAVARAAGGEDEDRSLPRLAVRGDAAADHGAARRPLFRAIHHALADG